MRMGNAGSANRDGEGENGGRLRKMEMADHGMKRV